MAGADDDPNTHLDDIERRSREIKQENERLKTRNTELETQATNHQTERGTIVSRLKNIRGILGAIVAAIAVVALLVLVKGNSGGDTMLSAKVDTLIRKIGAIDEKVDDNAIKTQKLASAVAMLASDTEKAKTKTVSVPNDWNKKTAEERYGWLIDTCKGTEAAWGTADEKMDKQLIAVLRRWKPSADEVKVFATDDCTIAGLKTMGMRTAETPKVDPAPARDEDANTDDTIEPTTAVASGDDVAAGNTQEACFGLLGGCRGRGAYPPAYGRPAYGGGNLDAILAGRALQVLGPPPTRDHTFRGVRRSITRQPYGCQQVTQHVQGGTYVRVICP